MTIVHTISLVILLWEQNAQYSSSAEIYFGSLPRSVCAFLMTSANNALIEPTLISEKGCHSDVFLAFRIEILFIFLLARWKKVLSDGFSECFQVLQ